MRRNKRAVRWTDRPTTEWAVIEPMIPLAKRGGRRRSVDLREVVQGLLYVLETGCGWRHLPKDFPPKSTVWEYFDLWDYDRTLVRIHEALYVALREAEGREASPTAAIIDSQTVKSADKGGLSVRKRAMTRARRPRACPGPRSRGVKRHVLVDTLGLMLRVVVHPASVQDRDGIALVLNRRTRRRFPFIDVVFADQGYQGPKAAKAVAATGTWRLEIVRRDPGVKGFEVLPKRVRRWPRTSGGLTAHRGTDTLLAQTQPAARQRLRTSRPNRRGLRHARHDQDHAKALGSLKCFPDRF